MNTLRRGGTSIWRAIRILAILTVAAVPAQVVARAANTQSVTAALQKIEAYIDEHIGIWGTSVP